MRRRYGTTWQHDGAQSRIRGTTRYIIDPAITKPNMTIQNRT